MALLIVPKDAPRCGRTRSRGAYNCCHRMRSYFNIIVTRSPWYTPMQPWRSQIFCTATERSFWENPRTCHFPIDGRLRLRESHGFSTKVSQNKSDNPRQCVLFFIGRVCIYRGENLSVRQYILYTSMQITEIAMELLLTFSFNIQAIVVTMMLLPRPLFTICYMHFVLFS